MDTEKTFDLKITNGAAKRLEALMSHFGVDEKKAVSLALELLDLVKKSKTVQFTEEGKEQGVELPTPKTNITPTPEIK